MDMCAQRASRKFVRKSCGLVLKAVPKSERTKLDRPSLNRLVRRLTAGDVVLVERLRCLAYSTPDLIAVLNSIHEKGAGFRSVFEEWCETTTHPNEVLLSTFRGLSNFESQMASDCIKRRGPRPILTHH